MAANPAVALAIATDTSALQALSERGLLALLRLETCPLWALDLAANHQAPRVQAACSWHISRHHGEAPPPTPAPPAVLGPVLATEASGFALAGLYTIPGLCPPWLLGALGASDDPRLRWLAALHPATPAATRELLSQDPDVLVRRAVAQGLAHGITDAPTIFQALGLGRRWNVATDPPLPRSVVDWLARDPEPSVRSALFERRDLPVALLAAAAADEHPTVRAVIAANPQTPAEVATRLLARAPDDVWIAALAHPTCPHHLLAEALADVQQHLHQVQVVAHNTERDGPMPWYAPLSRTAALAVQLARNPALSPSMLQSLVSGTLQQPQWVLVRALTDRDDLPRSAIEQFAAASQPFCRAAAASRPDLPDRALQTLTQDSDFATRRHTCGHPRLGIVCLPQAERWATHPDFAPVLLTNPAPTLAAVRQTAARTLSRHLLVSSDEPFLLALAALLPETPVVDLAALASPSADWLIAYALTQRPQLAPGIRDQLAHDGNWLVRCAAQSSPSVGVDGTSGAAGTGALPAGMFPDHDTAG